MTDLLPHILLITGTFIVAGLVKGVTGPGLPTVADPDGELLLRRLT